METRTDTIESLRRCLPDLVAFAAPPAVWTDLGPRGVAESLADVLLHSLGLDLVYVRVKGSSEEEVLEAARTAGQPEVAGQARAIGRALAPWLKLNGSSPPPSIPNPAGSGTVRLAVMPIGVEGE
jgi:hypothetical protein